MTRYSKGTNNGRATRWSETLPIRHIIMVVITTIGLVMGTARAEMVLRVANVGEPTTLDPHHVSGTWENRIIGDLFLGLTTEGPDGSTIAGAAESWTISDDGTVYKFKIRKHVWSDGTPVTAGDFVYALQRILKPETAAQYASLLYPIKNAEALNSGRMQGMDNLGIRAIDDQTLEVTLNAPTPYFVEQLTHYTAFPVPRHVVEQHGNDWIKKEYIVCNGPYVLGEWIPSTHVVLEKNPLFYDAANVQIDRVIYFPSEDRAANQKRFRAGEIDIAKDFASDQINWLKKNLPEQTHIAPFLGIYFYPINTQRPPFNDKRVRRALSMAINRKAITDKVLKTGEVPAYSMVPPGTGNYGEPSYVSWKDLPYGERITRAKQLLSDAGFGPNNPLKLTLSYNTSENHKRVAIAVAAMWKKLGVQTELFNTEVKVHYDNLQEGKFDIARAGWIADYNDPQNFLYLMETRTGPQNYGRYSNTEFDQLMAQAAQTKDLDKRAEILAAAEAIAMDDQPVMPIYYYVSKNLVSKNVVGWIDNAKDIQRTRFLAVQR